jgi:transcription termination/antitermination protein NusG
MTSKYEFAIDEKVRIKVGPFQNFTASVFEINKEKGLLRVKVDILGRSQPVEVTFLEVEKINPR